MKLAVAMAHRTGDLTSLENAPEMARQSIMLLDPSKAEGIKLTKAASTVQWSKNFPLLLR